MRDDYKNDWVEASLVKDLNYLKTGVEEYIGKKDYYSTGSIKDDSINSEGSYTHKDRPSRANRVGQIGDILQARMKDTDKAVLINDNLNDQLFSTGFFQIRTDPSTLLPKYLFHYFKSFVFLNQKDSYCSGSTQSALNDKSAKNLIVPISPIPVQRTIVTKLEELFSDLDKGIADLKKAQDQLKVYRQAVLKKAFEGELTKEWREQQSDLPTADELLEQIKEERQKHYEQQIENWKQAVKAWEENGKETKKPAKPQKPTNLDLKITILDEVASLLNVSDTWNIQPLAFISDNKPNCIVDGPFGSSINVAEDYKETGVPVVRMLNIRPFKYVAQNLKFIVVEKFNQLKRHNIISKDILIAKVGATIGDCCIYPDNQPEGMLSTTGSCRVRVDSKIYLPELLQYYIFFQKYKLKNIASQTAQPFLNMKVLKAYPIPFLTIREQHELIREIESRLSVCDKVEESITESLEKAKALRQSILKKAFEGTLLSEEEIAACKAAPDYEPASVLLRKN